MFWIALICLLVALGAYALGEGRVGEVAIMGAKIFAVVGLILILLSFFVGGQFWGGPWGQRW